MDGLLGGNQLGTLGLLGLNPDEINQSRNQAQSDMYFALASQLLGGGSTAASIAKGLQMGQQAYRNSLNEQTAERMQQVKLQEYLRQQQEAQAAKMRKAQVQQIVDQAYGPEVTPTTPLLNIYGQEVAGPNMPKPAGAGLTPQVINDLKKSEEGRKALTDIMAVQKAMAGDLTKVGAEEKLIRINPLTNEQEVVATGAPKEKTAPADIQGYQLAQSQGFKGSFIDYQTALKKAGATQNIVYPAGALTPDKGVAKDLQSALLQSGSRLSMYNQIESQFRPEYLQPKFKAGQAWNAIKEKAGSNLEPQDKQSLAQFSQFKQNAVNNLSQTIKDLTGASMGVQEAARIEAGLPSAGQGIFDGDSPTEFKAKLDNTIKELRLVEARNAYILRNGLSFKDVPLNNVPKLINDRASELAKQYQVDLKKPTPAQLNAIKRQLSVEFGISAD